MALRVAVISRDPETRLAAARAFDAAPPSWEVELHPSEPDEADVVVLGRDASGEGIVFDPAHPERVLAEVEAAAARVRSRLVVVTSPGGGSGATTVALHLAQFCAAAGAGTCYLDLDLRWGVRERLGLADDVRTWAQLDDDGDSLALCALPVAGGFRAVVSPPPGVAETPSVEDLHGMLERVAAGFDRVIVDAPTGPALRAAVSCAHAGVLVITPTLPAARRARDLISAHDGVPWAVVTNRLGPGGESRRRRLEEEVGAQIAVELPCAPALRDAEDDAGLLTVPWSRWRRDVARLAGALELS